MLPKDEQKICQEIKIKPLPKYDFINFVHPINLTNL